MDNLFERGYNSAAQAFPLRAVFRIYTAMDQQKDSIPLKVLISVGKKFFRHAVDRNRAKRQIREAWRLQSQALSVLAQERHLSVHIAFIWQSNRPMSTKTIQGAMHRLLTAIEVSITKKEHKL